MTMAIQRYFAEEREEEIGELAAINILEFITKTLEATTIIKGFATAAASLFSGHNC